MTLVHLIATSIGCLMLGQQPVSCVSEYLHSGNTLGVETRTPTHTGESIDVALTAQAALAWDVTTGAMLYEKNANEEREIASISKLLSALTIRDTLALDSMVEIPSQVTRIQRLGAHIKLLPGQHASVHDLLQAALIPSANDAMITLAVAASGTEENFVRAANDHGRKLGLSHTLLSNATGLSGGEQYSTANDVRILITRAYQDAALRQILGAPSGTLTTQEGVNRSYQSTNKLLKTYLPIEIAKTGYTIAAGENIALITSDATGHRIGIVVLGSTERFQDAKVLAEWIWRNWTWPKVH